MSVLSKYNDWKKHYLDMASGRIPSNQKVFTVDGTNTQRGRGLTVVSPTQQLDLQAKSEIKRSRAIKRKSTSSSSQSRKRRRTKSTSKAPKRKRKTKKAKKAKKGKKSKKSKKRSKKSTKSKSRTTTPSFRR